MKLDRPKLRALYRGPGKCEFCGLFCLTRECSHSMSRGAGWVDIPGNLTALCGPFGCHYLHGNGKEPTTRQLLEIAAKRDGTTWQAIEAEVWRIRALDKSGKEIKRGR